MDKSTEARIREKLMQERSEISDEMLRHGGPVKTGELSDLRDPEERASTVGDLWVDDQIAADDGNLLEKIDLALKRLDEGTYETCAGCGGPIPIERLMVKPSASLCVSCQEAKYA